MSAAPARPSVHSLSDGIADYLMHFGLSQSPFDDSIGAFFGAHGRQPLLAQLLHLLHFSEEPSLLVGAPGSGKSALLQELRRQLVEQDYVFYIVRSNISTSADLLLTIAKGIGLAVSEHDDARRLRARLEEWVEFSGGSLQVYLLVDDAEALSTEVVSTLRSLVATAEVNCWHLLAAGTEAMLDKFSTSSEPAQVFNMPEVTQDFVGDYLSFRLDQAGYDGPPVFDESDETLIYQASAGDLHRVHDSAEVALVRKLDEAQATSPLSLPLWHLGALVILLVVLGVAWLSNDRPQDDPASTVTTPLALDDSSQLPQAASGSVAQAPKVNEQPISTSAEVASESPVPESNGEVTPAAQEVEDPLMRSGSLEKASTAVIEKDVGTSQGISVPPKAAVSQAPAEAPVSSNSKYTADEQYLLSRPSSRFTLQVLAAASKAGVDRFIATHSQQPLRVYRTLRKGQPWHVVVLGDFSSSEEARSAIQKLPKSLQKGGPWPRDMVSVQQQINQQT